MLMSNRLARWVVLGVFLFGFCRAQAQPALLSSVPANGATGVSTTSTVVFTFNTPMNTISSSAVFTYGLNGFVPAASAWSANNTVLTCTPAPSFPANTNISWTVIGVSTNGTFINPPPTGSFTTGSGGGGGSNGTNPITIFEVGAGHFYFQTSSAPSMLFTDAPPYEFVANTVLSSNRFATNVTLTLPTASVFNLSPVPLSPWLFDLVVLTNDLTKFNAAFPTGNYTLTVRSVSSNQAVTVNWPATLLQPPAPHISNFPATQAVDSSQPFTLTWDAFSGGTASDFVSIQMNTTTILVSLPTNVMPGTATSVVIPAHTLQENQLYTVDLNFGHIIFTTNSTPYITEAFRSTTTQFSLQTIIAGTGSLHLTGLTNNSSTISFNVLVSAVPIVVVEYKTNLTAATWQTLLTTNNPGSQFSVSASHGSNKAMYFRARSGP